MTQNVHNGLGSGVDRLRDPVTVTAAAILPVPPSARRTPRTSSAGTPHHVRINVAAGEPQEKSQQQGVGHGNSSSVGSNSADVSTTTGVATTNANNGTSNTSIPRLSLQVPSVPEAHVNDQVPSNNQVSQDSSMYDLCGLVSHIGNLNQV